MGFLFQRALFHSFDSMTIGSSITNGDCNTIFFGRRKFTEKNGF